MQKLATIPSGFFVFIGMAILTMSLWAWSDIREIGTYEEWLIYVNLDQDPSLIRFSLAGEGGPQYYTRPLTWTPWWIGHRLSADNFTALNIVLLAIIALKGFAGYQLFRRLAFQNQTLAFVAAAMFIVFPSDSGNLTARTANIHFGLLFCITAMWLLTAAWQERNRWLLALAVVAQTISLFTYEAGVLMILAAPILIFWLERKINRRMLVYSLIWSVVPTLFFIALIALTFNAGSYLGSRMVTAGYEQKPSLIELFPAATLQLFNSHFIRPWTDSYKLLQFAGGRYVVTALIVTAAVLCPIAYILSRRSVKTGWQVTLGLMIGGIAFMGLGYGPYFLSENILSNWRVYLYSASGAAVAAVAAAYTLSTIGKRGQQIIFVALAGVMLTGSIVYTLASRSYYAITASNIENILVNVMEELPDVNEPATVVLFEEERPYRMAEAWYSCTLLSDCLTASLRYLYENPDVEGIVCSLGERAGYMETCELKPEGLVVTATNNILTGVRTFPYDSLIAVNLEANQATLIENIPVATTYDPERFFSPTLAQRVPEALPVWHQEPVERYSVEFTQEAVDGEGWSGTEPIGTWTNAASVSLNTRLSPAHEYIIQFRLVDAITPEHRESLALFVNDKPVTLKLIPGEIFEGVIPSTVIESNPRRTRIMFETLEPVTPQSVGRGNDMRLLGVQFEWLKIEPQ